MTSSLGSISGRLSDFLRELNIPRTSLRISSAVRVTWPELAPGEAMPASDLGKPPICRTCGLHTSIPES